MYPKKLQLSKTLGNINLESWTKQYDCDMGCSHQPLYLAAAPKGRDITDTNGEYRNARRGHREPDRQTNLSSQSLYDKNASKQ